MSSGIQAGTTFPVAVKNDDDVEHRRRLADAINELAAAAFTPFTQISELEDVDFAETPGADLFTPITVTPFVPARAHVIVILMMVNSDPVVDLNATFQIMENDVLAWELSNVYSATGGARFEIMTMQVLRDLEPNTTYVYNVRGILGGPTESALAALGSSMTVRLEHRKITT